MVISMRNTRGQSVAEYAILVGVVIAAIIGMQLYVKRGLQAKSKAVVDDFALAGGKGASGIASKQQYEPYYTAAGAITNETVNTELATGSAGGMVAITGINASSNRTGTQTQGANLGADGAWQ